MSTNSANTMSSQQALLELTVLNAEQANLEFDDVVIEGVMRGLPPEIVTRLQELWEQTRVIAGEVISIGKIIVNEIMRFLKANPHMAAGLAIGAAVGALVGLIPFIGPMLAPITMTVGAVFGAGLGASIQRGDYSGSPIGAAIALAEKFFELFARIINAVGQYIAA